MPAQLVMRDKAADNAVRRRGGAVLVGAVCLALIAAACGSSPTVIRGSSDSNGGVVVISEAASYTYSLTVCARNILRLRSDSGQTDDLAAATGQLYLTIGNWTGTAGVLAEAFEPSPGCAWSVTLTSTS